MSRWPKTVDERFWGNVDKSGGPDACWLWNGARNANGYGRVNIGNPSRTVMAHRAVWQIVHGHIPDALCILHRCDNPACVNPAHLFLGTMAENNADRDMKGRARGGSRPGEKHHAAKLTDDQINEIRKATGLQREIAERFGVSQQSVSMIRNRKTWNHIT